ncbi:MAG: hypothetical protein MUO34_07665 [Ignavibacteriaceae bacterium]|nr:hypothetical protein [Ignavibacteriaceae bacterium]
MKTGIILLVIFVALFIVEDAISQQITYSGTVEYKHTRTKTANGSGSDGINWNVKVHEKYIVEGTFYVTFTGGVSSSGVALFQFTGINEKISFINTVNNEAKEERIRQACYDGKLRFTHSVSPGNSRIHNLSLESERLEPTKPCVTGGFLGIQCPPSDNKQGSCKYSIMLMGNIKANVTSALYTEETFPCNEANNKPANLFTNTVKMDFPIVINLEKDFNITDAILEGNSIITDIHHTKCNACLGSTPTIMVRGDLKCAYDENVTVSWKLNKWCEALDQVGKELDKKDISDHTKNRIKKVLAGLKNPEIDPYVMLSWELISMVKTSEQAQNRIYNKEKGFMDNLREILIKDCERQKKDLDALVYNIINVDTKINKIIHRFQSQYLSEHILTPGQVVLKDWVVDQQQNPNSIYSCYAGK